MECEYHNSISYAYSFAMKIALILGQSCHYQRGEFLLRSHFSQDLLTQRFLQQVTFRVHSIRATGCLFRFAFPQLFPAFQGHLDPGCGHFPHPLRGGVIIPPCPMVYTSGFFHSRIPCAQACGLVPRVSWLLGAHTSHWRVSSHT